MIHLVHHLLVLLKEVGIHCVVILGVQLVLPIVSSVDVFVCLPVFFIKLSNRRIEHHKRHVVVILLMRVARH